MKIDVTSHPRGYLSTNYDIGGLAIYEQLHLGFVNERNITARKFDVVLRY